MYKAPNIAIFFLKIDDFLNINYKQCEQNNDVSNISRLRFILVSKNYDGLAINSYWFVKQK